VTDEYKKMIFQSNMITLSSHHLWPPKPLSLVISMPFLLRFKMLYYQSSHTMNQGLKADLEGLNKTKAPLARRGACDPSSIRVKY